MSGENKAGPLGVRLDGRASYSTGDTLSVF